MLSGYGMKAVSKSVFWSVKRCLPKARNQHVEKEIREAIASLLVPSLVMIGFTLFFSFWAITWITRPLNRLRTSLANRSADNLSPLPMYSDMDEMVAVTTFTQSVAGTA